MKEFIKAIFAGFMIGIAGTIYLKVEPSWIGAILFSIGLIIICLNGFNLFTGKIGYIKSYKEIPMMLVYILGNLLGVAAIAFITAVDANELVINKLTIPYHLVLLKSIGCGFLMYLAVNSYKIKNSIIAIVGCVAAFIICGFEHSIADMFYMFCSNGFSIDKVIFIIIVLLGNTIGALLHKMRRFRLRNL